MHGNSGTRAWPETAKGGRNHLMTGFPDSLRTLARSLLPEALLRGVRDWRRERIAGAYGGLSTRAVFEKIYADAAWGRPKHGDSAFYSGDGSHEPAIVTPYVEAVGAFLLGFEAPPDVIDVGCGDFHVGVRLRPFCARYTACDVVAGLIAQNRERFREADVDFRLLDITAQTPEFHDVMLVRRVLQHLSNTDIAAALPRIAASCRHLVLTEHVPVGSFTPNLDKATGPDTRLPEGSGVVVTAPPFSLVVKSERLLCKVPHCGGMIRTVVYELAEPAHA